MKVGHQFSSGWTFLQKLIYTKKKLFLNKWRQKTSNANDKPEWNTMGRISSFYPHCFHGVSQLKGIQVLVWFFRHFHHLPQGSELGLTQHQNPKKRAAFGTYIPTWRVLEVSDSGLGPNTRMVCRWRTIMLELVYCCHGADSILSHVLLCTRREFGLFRSKGFKFWFSDCFIFNNSHILTQFSLSVFISGDNILYNNGFVKTPHFYFAFV